VPSRRAAPGKTIDRAPSSLQALLADAAVPEQRLHEDSTVFDTAVVLTARL
jgi:hypothetical protein